MPTHSLGPEDAEVFSEAALQSDLRAEWHALAEMAEGGVAGIPAVLNKWPWEALLTAYQKGKEEVSDYLKEANAFLTRKRKQSMLLRHLILLFRTPLGTAEELKSLYGNCLELDQPAPSVSQLQAKLNQIGEPVSRTKAHQYHQILFTPEQRRARGRPRIAGESKPNNKARRRELIQQICVETVDRGEPLPSLDRLLGLLLKHQEDIPEKLRIRVSRPTIHRDLVEMFDSSILRKRGFPKGTRRSKRSGAAWLPEAATRKPTALVSRDFLFSERGPSLMSPQTGSHLRVWDQQMGHLGLMGFLEDAGLLISADDPSYESDLPPGRPNAYACQVWDKYTPRPSANAFLRCKTVSILPWAHPIFPSEDKYSSRFAYIVQGFVWGKQLKALWLAPLPSFSHWLWKLATPIISNHFLVVPDLLPFRRDQRCPQPWQGTRASLAKELRRVVGTTPEAALLCAPSCVARLRRLLNDELRQKKRRTIPIIVSPTNSVFERLANSLFGLPRGHDATIRKFQAWSGFVTKQPLPDDPVFIWLAASSSSLGT